MKLNFIENDGLWKDFANYLNYNFNKLGIVTRRVDEIGSAWLSSYKGAFRSLSELRNCYPNPLYGDYALVLSSGPLFVVYAADINGVWQMTDGRYNPEVDIRNYIEYVKLSSIHDIDDDIQSYLNGN
jgi:hypothetical protein